MCRKMTEMAHYLRGKSSARFIRFNVQMRRSHFSSPREQIRNELASERASERTKRNERMNERTLGKKLRSEMDSHVHIVHRINTRPECIHNNKNGQKNLFRARRSCFV